MVIADPCVDAEGRAGRRAASRGKEAKDAVLGVLKERELRPKRNEMIGTSLMGSAERSDFYLDDLPQFPDGLAIKVRSQFTSGTADEKLFGLAANIKATYECPTVVVLGGDGFRPLIVEWLRSQVGGRLLAVLTIEEFGAWAASNL